MYAYDVAGFLRYLQSSKGRKPYTDTDIHGVTMDEVAAVTTKKVENYLFFLAKQGNGASTRSAKLSAISSFYRYLESKGYVESNPTERIERPKINDPLPKYLTAKEANQLLDTVLASPKINGTRDYCILALFLNCGLRLDELRSINVEDISSERKTLVVTGKGSKQREVPLNDMVLGAVEDYLLVRKGEKIAGGEKALFTSRQTHKRLSREAIQKMVERRLQEAGLGGKHLSTHKLRHTAATLMHQAGSDIRVVQEVLGHASLSSTEIYTHVSSAQKAEAVRNNPLNIIEDSEKD
jgi:site-specific recombinase XerD